MNTFHNSTKKHKLTANNITVSYENSNVIEDVSLELNEGEIVCILGASGVGKTTLFNVISGLLNPDEGTVKLEGVNITGKAGSVSYMLQKDLLLPYKTIIDNVSLPLVIRGEKKSRAREIAMEHFKEFGLEKTEYKYPKQLSGGMRQRAALLRTYLFSDKVALLDEPFSALDSITKSSMHQWYLKVMEQIKLSTLLITHDVDEAIVLADRIYIMAGKPGRITEEVEINETRPRKMDFNVSESFMNYKRYILNSIEKS